MKHFKSNDGVALIMVLWTIVILSFLLVSLAEDIRLESFLTRNLMDQIQVQYIAQAGIARGLAELTNDQSIADGLQENWLVPIKGQIENQGTFKVSIEDIGSRFNINYIGEPVLGQLIAEFEPEFKDWRLENLPIYLVQEIEEFVESGDKKIKDLITFYGKFNLNIDDYSVLKEMMINHRISEWIADQVVQELQKLEEPLRSKDDLLLKVPSLDMSTYDLIEDEVDIVGNLNVNQVDEEIITLLLEVLKIPQDRLTVITTMREKETIDNLQVLAQPIGEEEFQKLVPYLTVTSRYFRITSTAESSSTSIQKTIIIEVERIPEKVARGEVLEWGTKILSWVES